MAKQESIFSLYREFILKQTMANPSLGEDTDYLPNRDRYRVYKEAVNYLTEDEVIDEVIYWTGMMDTAQVSPAQWARHHIGMR